MITDPREQDEINRVVNHIGGMNKAIEICRLAVEKPSRWGNSQEALNALRDLIGGSRRPPGVFPILEHAIAGVATGIRDLDLQRTLDLLKRYCNLP